VAAVISVAVAAVRGDGEVGRDEDARSEAAGECECSGWECESATNAYISSCNPSTILL
jgi:hypothetical protein